MPPALERETDGDTIKKKSGGEEGMKKGGTEIEKDVGDRDMTGEGGDYVGRGAKKDMKRR